MDQAVWEATAQRLGNSPDPHIIHFIEVIYQLRIGKLCKIIGQKAVYMLLQGADGLHQGALKVGADTHNLARCLHLGSQSTLSADKLIKWKSRHLYYAVVQHRFKACVGFLCNGIFDLIQSIAQSNLCSHLCDRISCRLGSQGRRTAHTGIYLDDAVFKAVWI